VISTTKYGNNHLTPGVYRSYKKHHKDVHSDRGQSQPVLRLLDAGWRLAVVWECALVGRHRMPLEDCIDQLVAWIKDPRALGIELEGVPGKLSS
jgi:G:T-mismatch repair DNA endonuclease (very short patch repair protein)